MRKIGVGKGGSIQVTLSFREIIVANSGLLYVYRFAKKYFRIYTSRRHRFFFLSDLFRWQQDWLGKGREEVLGRVLREEELDARCGAKGWMCSQHESEETERRRA